MTKMQGVIQILVKWELSLWQVCLEDKYGVSSNVYLKDINIMKKQKVKKIKDDQNVQGVVQLLVK